MNWSIMSSNLRSSQSFSISKFKTYGGKKTFIFQNTPDPQSYKKTHGQAVVQKGEPVAETQAVVIAESAWKMCQIVPLKTTGQPDWLSETFFKVRLKTNNTDGKCLKWNLRYNNVVTRVLSHFVITLKCVVGG